VCLNDVGEGRGGGGICRGGAPALQIVRDEVRSRCRSRAEEDAAGPKAGRLPGQSIQRICIRGAATARTGLKSDAGVWGEKAVNTGAGSRIYDDAKVEPIDPFVRVGAYNYDDRTDGDSKAKAAGDGKCHFRMRDAAVLEFPSNCPQ